MGPPYTVVFEFQPDPVDMAFLEERLAEAAVSAAGVGEEQEFAVIVRDDKRIVAGASGAMWGGGCQVHVLWVDETVRHQGLGRDLMTEVERSRSGAGLSTGHGPHVRRPHR